MSYTLKIKSQLLLRPKCFDITPTHLLAVDISSDEKTHCSYWRRVIGLATAWVLVKQGHQVQLLERNSQAGVATSFANGGQLSYRYVAPLADKGVPMQGLKWMGKSSSP